MSVETILSNSDWIIAFCFGAVLVIIYSLSRFDEPSYDSQTEFFSRYRPRFSTSHASYTNAKLGYVASIFTIYAVCSFMPKAFGALAGKGSDLLSPLAMAMYIVSIQNVPVLKDVEGKIRGILHSFAQVPEGIRRTIAQMCGSEFKIDSGAKTAQARKLSPQSGPAISDAELDNLLLDDEVLSDWFRVGSLLCALSEQNRLKCGIDLIFFEYYKDEFDSIKANHAILAESVRQHLDSLRRKSTGPSISSVDVVNGALFNDVRTLRHRLFTFVACGVRCSVHTEVESADILRRLGFSSGYTGADSRDIGEIVLLLAMVLMIVSVFFVFSVNWVRGTIPKELSDTLKLPDEPIESLTLFMATALFYFSAIVGALWHRERRVRHHEWFDINALSRRRPWLKYVKPTLVGALCGWGTLFMIALLCGPGFRCDNQIILGPIHINAPGEAFLQTILWSPLAIVMSFTTLWLADSAATNDGEPAVWRKFLFQSLAGASAMALMGFLLQPELSVTDVAMGDWIIAKAFLPSQILLLVFVMCIIVQAHEFYGQDARRLVGRGIQAISAQGPMFAMLLDRTGRASRFPANEKHFNVANAVSYGRWLPFPEGTVIQWTNEDAEDPSDCHYGLIASSEETLTYQAFNDRISGPPEYIAQLDLRAVPSMA